jgi:hypothetical protein
MGVDSVPVSRAHFRVEYPVYLGVTIGPDDMFPVSLEIGGISDIGLCVGNRRDFR